jgi:predicted transcriptional regulator of viral defense system
MQKYITQLGPREAEFISRLAGQNKGILTIRDALDYWKSRKLAYAVLQRLERKGWLARIEPGKYLIIPLEAGPDRQWTEDPYLIAAAMAQPFAIAYWSAIRHWGWTEQIPRIVYVQTPRRKNQTRRTVFGVTYEFVTVNPRKFFGHAKEWRNGKQVLVTNREKTLVDCSDDVERGGTIEELAKAVRSSVREISWQTLNEYVISFPNGAVPKRLGYLFEALVPELPAEATQVLSSWQKKLSAGVVLLQPMKSKGGKISTRWRTRANVTPG